MIKNQKDIFGKSEFNEILGQEKAKMQIKSALIMGRHIIIVGQPGIGKTTLAKNIANSLPEIKVMDCEFNCNIDNPVCPLCKAGKTKGTKTIKGEERFIRIQGSPDLTVEDLLGDIDPVKALKYGPLSIEAFTPGKIFRANNGVLFFDEINRCSEKLQNSLLQVLQEGVATIGSYDVDFPADLIFIGTMNPEDTATEPLSTVFLDRFDMIYMVYPETNEIEVDIVKKYGKSLDTKFPDKLLSLVILFIRLLRESDKLQKHPGVRASLGLYERAQANAYLKGSKDVRFDDVKEAIVSVLSHRIELKPSIKYLQSPEDFISKEFKDFVRQHPDIEEYEGDVP